MRCMLNITDIHLDRGLVQEVFLSCLLLVDQGVREVRVGSNIDDATETGQYVLWPKCAS